MWKKFLCFHALLESSRGKMACAKAFQFIALFTQKLEFPYTREIQQIISTGSRKQRNFSHIRSKNQFVVITSLFCFSQQMKSENLFSLNLKNFWNFRLYEFLFLLNNLLLFNLSRPSIVCHRFTKEK